MSESDESSSDDGAPETDMAAGQPTEHPTILPPFAELQHQLQQDPDAGAHRLEQIRRQLQDGYYLTRAAAEESARRLLDDSDVRPGDQQ